MKFKKAIIAPLIVASIVIANFGSAFAEKRNESPNEISEVKILEVTSESKDTPQILSFNSPQTVQNDLPDEASPLLSTDADSQKDSEIIPKSEGPTKNSRPNLPQLVQSDAQKKTMPSSPTKKEGISRNMYGWYNVVKHPFGTLLKAWGLGLLATILTGISYRICFVGGLILEFAVSYFDGYFNAPVK